MVPLLLAVDKSHLVEHLKFFQELGVTGVSLDPRWRRRASLPNADAPEPLALDEPTADARPVLFARSQEALQAIRDDIGDCTRCKLHTLGRRQVVVAKEMAQFGHGETSSSEELSAACDAGA